MRKSVSLFMDVEDPINPLADDAALDFGNLFTRAGVTGSFCVTGEKCRTLLARGRRDVLDALAPHAFGLHTDTHSFHPSTMEMLADCDFAEGSSRAFRTEGRGAAAFESAFGRKPAFWGGAGNTWSVEITDALAKLAIPAYAYALTAIPDDGVHRLNGALALPQALSVSELESMDDSRAAAAMERVLSYLESSTQPWVGIFVGHPTKMRHRDYWDAPYYAGRTPPEPEFTEPVSDREYAAAKRNLAQLLDRLAQVVDIVSVPDVIGWPWTFRPPTAEERAFFEARTAANLRSAIGWPIHRPGLSAERIVAKTLALASTLEVVELRD